MKLKSILSILISGCLLLLFTMRSTAQTVYVVTDSSDLNVPGTLRYSMTQAMLNTGISIIRFNIPTPTFGEQITINLTGTLPSVTKTVWIDGTTQPGYSAGNPMIKIIGTGTGTGIAINSVLGCKIMGLYIQSFVTGVDVLLSDYTEIRNCIINKCSEITIRLHSSSYCTVKGNYLNVAPDGVNTVTNAEEGVFLTNNGTIGSTYNTIGGSNCEEGNTAAFLRSEGIDNYGNIGSNINLNIGNRYSGNKFFSNTGWGILLRSAANANIQPPVISTPASCVLGGTSAVPFGIVEVFSGAMGVSDKKDALYFLASTTANASGTWSVPIGVAMTDRVTATIADPLTGNTSELATAVAIDQSFLGVDNNLAGSTEGDTCLGAEMNFSLYPQYMCASRYLWDYGDGSPLTENASHYYSTQNTFDVKVFAYSQSGCASLTGATNAKILYNCFLPCTSCLSSFEPEAGEYILQAWVKKENNTPTDITYSSPQIKVSFPSSAVPPVTFSTNGNLIEGWQRIEGKFTVPASGVNYIGIDLMCASGNGDCLFDDVRVFPVNGSMKSYVYDVETLRLVAELDENNYSTMYEYDDEGKLIRVKKETERGVMTIKENRDSTNKP